MRKFKFLAVILAVCCFCSLLGGCNQSEHDPISTGGECNQSEHDQILADWKKIHNIEGEEFSVECYGKFDAAHVVLFYGGVFACVEGGETVDGVDFHYNYAALCLYVWQDGMIYTLQEAFDIGILTHKNLLTVRENHKAAFPFMYENDAK